MPTLNQIIRVPRRNIKPKIDRTLGLSPQRKAICTKIGVTAPKKPNSASRAYAEVSLSASPNSKKRYKLKDKVKVYIPYEKHNLKVHSTILLERRNVGDLPGIQHRAIRGKLDFQGVAESSQGRSRKGNKKPKASAK